MLLTVINILLLSVLIPYIIHKHKTKDANNLYFIYTLLLGVAVSLFFEANSDYTYSSIVIRLSIIAMFCNYFIRRLTGKI